MKEMERVRGIVLLLVTLLEGIQGQVITPLSVDVAVNGTTSLVCTTSATASISFVWTHITTSTTVYSGGQKFPPPGTYENFDLDEDITAKTSKLIINNIQLRDRGEYQCTVAQQPIEPAATVNVEGGSEVRPLGLISIDSDTNYQATCEAIGSLPEETITWILDGEVQTTPSPDIVETDPQISDDALFDKRSVFTFPATFENYNTSIECNISGHQVSSLNRQVSRLVDIHNPPEDNGIEIGFNSDGTNLVVSCDINPAVDPAIPAMDMFYIYENGTLRSKPLSDSRVTVTEPEQDTEYKCVGGNYLGNTTAIDTFQPGRTTTLPTPTGNDGPSAAAIGGGVAGAIVFIIIIVIVIIYFKKRGKDGPSGASSTKKHGSSTVGTSNGSEKDKIKPVAAPRDQGSIQHTTDNPGQAEYAMVDRKKPGDMPDTRGPGQKEPQGMLYADLDLSASAGHTEKKVPQNKDDVVVYSSILV